MVKWAMGGLVWQDRFACADWQERFVMTVPAPT